MLQINTIKHKLKQPKVVIILVNWNGWRDTSECLLSLMKINYINYKVIIVDNASSDGSIRFLKEKFPKVTIVENAENLGYTGGLNVGIQWAKQEGAEYVLCLNNDTIVDKDLIKELVIVGEQLNDAGGLCPKEYDYYNSNTLVYAGGKISRIRSKNFGYRETDYGQYDTIRDTKMLCGVAMMLKTKALLKVGLFDVDFFFDWEDKDLAFRLMKNGFKLVYVPKAKLWHKEFRISRKVNLLKIYFSIRNHILFVRKNGKSPEIAIVMAYLLFYSVPYLFFRSLCDGKNLFKPALMAVKWHINRNLVPKDSKMVELMVSAQKAYSG